MCKVFGTQQEERMTAKKFFRSLYYAQISIRKKQEKIEELQQLAESTGAIRYDKLRVVTSSPQSGGFEDLAVKIMDLQKKLREDIDDLTDRLSQGRKMINSLDDPADKLILTMRYINHMKWEEIAAELNYSVDHVYYRHRQALKRIKDNSF